MRAALLATVLLAACGSSRTPESAPSNRAVTSTPPADAGPPGSDSADYRAMSDALGAYCADAAKGCAQLAGDFAAGKTEWRNLSLIGAHGPDLLAIDALGGYWQGAVFHREGEQWLVTGIVGGDIP